MISPHTLKVLYDYAKKNDIPQDHRRLHKRLRNIEEHFGLVEIPTRNIDRARQLAVIIQFMNRRQEVDSTGPEITKDETLTPKEKDSLFYLSSEWREMRTYILDIYGSKCMKCRTSEGEFHVDHIIPRSIRKDLELEPDNLQVLCRFCNVSKSNRNQIDYRADYIIDTVFCNPPSTGPSVIRRRKKPST